MTRVGLTADRLTSAGAELADEVGFEHVTLTALARRFGVKSASLYSHVQSTDDLKTRIALLALDELATQASEALAGRAGGDALIALGSTYRTYAREHPGRFAAANHRVDPQTAVTSAGPQHSQMMHAILRGYGVPDEDFTHAVRLLGSVFQGYVTLELAGSFDHSAPGPDESWTRILDVLDALLRHWPTP
ncbi:TetR/AcrR family transcriptional regulator [Nocardia sp. 348MFTsu5.1]|uniref:TetR/AcrR family transcriptional regulator n=1 Tax=Nocardia sp. 348MFTsu5.1 TaxID=1172185 RepID=UPI00037097C9|nr:TetR/AcrR family transcriptional regulator [Nocardia sp. 348MFTsu5.1]